MSERGVRKKNVLYKTIIRVFQLDGVTPKTGLVSGDFVKLLLLDGVSDATAVTVTEAGVANGYYVVSYTPVANGYYFLNVSNALYCPFGFSDEIDVFDEIFGALSNLDAPISSRADASVWTAGRASTLDATISSRATAAFLDVPVSSRAAAGDAMTLEDDSIDAATITAAAANKVADHTLRRKTANARGSANGDALDKRSLLGSTSFTVNKKAFVGGQLLIFDETDAGVPVATFNGIGTPGADPVTSLTPA